MSHTHSDQLLVAQIRRGDSDAWGQLIARYEGRLLAFIQSRLRHRQTSEDVVQEAFVGFLTSLPNYDGRRDLESYLFGIAAHKLSDHLRKQGRRAALATHDSGPADVNDLPGSARRASSLVRSAENRHLEEAALAQALSQLVRDWRSQREWAKLQCVELLWVRGWANKVVAKALGISEQTVANQKFQAVARLRRAVVAPGQEAVLPPELDESPSSHVSAPAAEPPEADPFSTSELLAYCDEALPAEQMASVEEALRGSETLRRKLAGCLEMRDARTASVGDVWRRCRLSCPSRSQLGRYVLRALEPDFAEYVTFHCEVVGCRACAASVADLHEQQQGAPAAESSRRRERFFQSSAGLLSGSR